MRVTVRLMGPFRAAAGVTDDVVLEVREPTLGGVLAAISERYPAAGRKLQPAPGKVEPAVRVVLNDVVLPDANVAVRVKDGDRLAFVPVVGGG
ncbi:MAG TPA: MoaD/ThiS family protein [Thermoplasmata archaeon]